MNAEWRAGNRVLSPLHPSSLILHLSSFILYPSSFRIHHSDSGTSIFSSWAALRSLLSARASICRIRSFVTPSSAPTSLSVSGSPPPPPPPPPPTDSPPLPLPPP